MNSTIPNSENPKPHGAGMHTHWLRGACIVSATALLLAPGLRAQTDAPKSAPAAKENPKPKTQAVRQKFVPAPADPSRGNGADFTALHHLVDDDPDVLMLMAHAGVGDSFPVQEDGKPKAFVVKVASGNDNKLELEIPWDKEPETIIFDKGPQKLTLQRDGATALSSEGFRYVFSYPSVTVAPDGKDTTDKAMIIVNRIPLNSASATSTEKGVRLYSMRFDGSNLLMLQDTLRRAFPKDSVVLSASAESAHLSAFEIRNVRLTELARTIEFLSDGRLSVEVVEKDGDTPGNVWRIAGKNPAVAAAATKMRSVAAPHLFADEKKLDRFHADADEMERQRYSLALDSSSGGHGNDGQIRPTRIQRLSSQKVFVLIGSEDGVAGMEGFIKAAEQRAADDAAAKDALAAAIAPKMHAVAAPHLFANDARLKGFMKEAETMRKEWDDFARFFTKEAG